MEDTGSSSAFSLVFVSRWPDELVALNAMLRKSTLAKIATVVQAEVDRCGVHGVVLCSDGDFIGWIEGAEPTVRAFSVQLPEWLRTDAPQVIHTETGEEALLTGWTLAMVARSDGARSVAQLLARLRAGKVPRMRRNLAATILRHVIEPPSDTARAARPRRIALIGQSGMWTSALMAHLTGAYEQPVNKSRLTGGPSMAAEGVIEYLDFDHPALGPVQMVNFSGDLASMAWLEHIEEKMSACVLFFSISNLSELANFTNVAMKLMGNFGRFKPVVCLFGRTASALMDPVQDWLAGMGRVATATQMSLADANGVWQVIQGSTGEGSSTRFDAGTFIASVPPAVEVTTVEPVIAPMIEFHLSGLCVVHETSTGVSHEPSGQEPTRLPKLTPIGREWLASLLEIGGVCGVGAQCVASSSAVEILAHAPGMTNVDVKQLEMAFRGQLKTETEAHLLLNRMYGVPSSGHGQQMLTRWSDHFCLSVMVPAASPTVVVLEFSNDFVNQSMAMAGLAACLRQLPTEIFG